jgi:hypothetical protein
MAIASLPLALNSRGADVQSLHADLRKIGLNVPPRELDVGLYGPGTQETILQFQAKTRLPPTGVFDDATRAALAVAAGGVEGQNARVEGRILFDHGAPADGIFVRVYNRGFGGTDKIVGETVKTDSAGYFTTPYPSGTANLDVRVLDSQGKEISLTRTRFSADKYELINVVAPASIRPLAPEFTRLSADLTQQVGGQLSKLLDAQENEDRQDLSLLHQTTGWDARLIATATTAVSLAKATGMTTDACYALLRAGLPSDQLELARVNGDTVTAALKRANDSGLAALADAQIADAQKAFANFARSARLGATHPSTLASPGDLIKAAGLNDNLAANFANVVLTAGPSNNDFWKQVEAAGIPKAQIDVLKLQGNLAFLTLNNIALIKPLLAQIATPDKLANMVDLDLHTSKAWTDRLNAAAGNNDPQLAKLIPPGYQQEKVADRRDAYAADLARQVRVSFPTRAIGRMVEKDNVHLAVNHDALKGSVGTFMRKAADLKFELGRTPVGAFIRDHKAELFNGIPQAQADATSDAVRTLHRLYQISPSDQAMDKLAVLGFRSARDVVAFSEDVFIDRYANQFSSIDIARLIYRKAQQVSVVTYNLFTGAKKIESTPDLPVTAPPADTRQAVQQQAKDSLIKQFPTMETLFGSLDFCNCDQCRSVLSPAAYLVDLLRFLDPEQAAWNSFLDDWKTKHNNDAYDGPKYKYLKPFDALLLRRPDLANLELTCENTNTAMPYIDIVNEVLEYYVANDKLAADTAYQTSSTAQTPDLLAEPQHAEPAAYAKLASARYPLALPFDLWLETVRRLFNLAGVPLAKVLEVFRPADDLFPPAMNPKPYYRVAVFAESLGVSPDEFKLLTDANPLAGWQTLFGFDDPGKTAAQNQQDALAALPSAKTFSQRLVVTYQDLVNLMKTRFVNPRLNGLVLLRKLQLSIDDVFRYKKHPKYKPLSPDEEKAFNDRLDQLTKTYNPNADPNGFDARKALDTAYQGGKLDKVLLLAAPDAGCDFSKTVFQFADATPADAFAFLRVHLLVRIWRKLGWTMEETDRALCAFLPVKPEDLTGANVGSALQTALIYLAHFKALDDRLELGADSRLRLLTFWTNMPTTGANPLYAQRFLTPGILKGDAVFDDPLGNYLSNPALLLKDHLLGVQAGLNLTADEIGLILDDAGLDRAAAKLTLDNISLLYRFGLLAKALKLSVRDLISLKRLSGLDPFKPLIAGPITVLDNDYPFTQTSKFIEWADQVRDSGFSIEDLAYLLHHKILDPVGKYRTDPTALLALVQSLAAGLRPIATDHAVPSDPASLTDDLVRQTLGLVLPADVVEQFFGFWNKRDFLATKANIAPAQQMDPAVYQVDAIQVRYDVTRQEQRVTYKGTLSAGRKKSILLKVPAPPANAPQPVKDAFANFTAMLDSIANDSQMAARAFLAKEFVGFVTYDDVFGAGDAGIADADMRKNLLTAFLPFLRRQLVRQLVVRTVATALNVDPTLCEALLTEPALMADPDQAGQPFLGLFAGVAESGISAQFFASADGTGNPLAALTIPAPDTTLKQPGGQPYKPNGTNSARFAGYLEVPTGGAYRFFARLGKKDATVKLRFDHLPDPLIDGKAAADGDELSQFTDLKPGVPYRFTVEANALAGGDIVVLVSADALPKDTLARMTLYPQAAVDRFDRGRILLAKAFQVIQGFGFTEREVRHILTHRADFSGIDFAKLPTATIDAAAAVPFFTQFLRLARYARLKEDLAGGGDDLIGVLQANGDDVYKKLADLSRREQSAVKAAATQLGVSATEPAVGLPRLWDALQIIAELGIPVETIAAATKIVSPAATPDDRYAIARDVRSAIRSRYEPDTWRPVAQSVFDLLRKQQRDALVAYVLHRLEPMGIERIEQLFEYFLIDPGMEPVVQTSRLRLAISSVQTFIQRCFLNLETRVHPSALNAPQWQWMKRYRVWEANRKIFLYPENWLEPEFRDDKTDLYLELESALVQGDVSADLVEDALFKYLNRLEQIARLQIVTMYADENANDPSSTILHVIGRTFNSPHKYYYRRFTHMTWTPWEPVGVDVEGDHITAVVWRERLHLFWVKFMEKSPPPDLSDHGETKHAADMTPGELKGVVKSSAQAGTKLVDVQLSWSELYQGAWTPPTQSGFGIIANQVVPAGFTPASTFIFATKEYDNGEERAAVVSLNGDIEAAFRLTSKNSPPTWAQANGAIDLPYVGAHPSASEHDGTGPFHVSYVSQIVSVLGNSTPTTSDSMILNGGSSWSLVLCQNLIALTAQVELFRTLINVYRAQLGTSDPMLRAIYQGLIDGWEAQIKPAESDAQNKALIVPFFYQDELNTFFVDPTLTETTFVEWTYWGVGIAHQNPIFTIDHIKQIPLEPHVPIRELPVPVSTGDPISRIRVRPRQDWLADPATALQFGDRLIGSTGGLPAQLPAPSADGGEDGAGRLHGTGVGPGRLPMIFGAGGAIAHVGSTDHQFNVVASSGVSPAALNNILDHRGPGALVRLRD